MKEKLLSVTASDCRWDYYRGSGNGGQKRHKTSSAVRCTHIESGAAGQSEDGRSQIHNKRVAFKRMTETECFKRWLRIKTAEVTGVHAEAKKAVERAMKPENLCVEVKSDGKWVKE